MTFASWSSTASNNTTINGVNIAENCPAGNVNDMGRQIMADMRTAISSFAETILDDTSAGAVRTTISAAENTAALSSVATLTPAADRMAYYSGASTAALTAITAFARTLLDDADASTARDTLGAIGVAASSLGSPGYIKFDLPGTSTNFIIQWGTTTALANTGSQSVTYPTAFATFSVPVVTGGLNQTNYDQNFPAAYASSTTGFNFVNAADSSMTLFWIAVGV